MVVKCLIAILFVASISVYIEASNVLCSSDVVPGLDGAWLCNRDWVIDSSNGEQVDAHSRAVWNCAPGSQRGFLVVRLPKFYVLRGIKLRSIGGPGIRRKLRLSYWNDQTVEPYAPGSTQSSNWISLKNFEFSSPLEELRGFSRLARFWKLEISSNGNHCPAIIDLAFFVVADVAAMSNYFVSEKEKLPRMEENYKQEAAPAGDTCQQVTSPVPQDVVTKYRLDTSFYRKHTSAYGIPILGNSVLDNRALQRACYVVRFMLADRADMRNHMYSNRGRVAIIGRRETVPMVPEMRIFYWWTRRAAGGTFEIPVNVGAEENMLCEPQDTYARSQDIFMHEFAHGMHLIAARTAIPDFNARLQRSFNQARRSGIWRNTYANTDHKEYFAEGVQAFFNQQREGPPGGDGIQNHVNTRGELRKHDRSLYRLVEEIFPCKNPYIARCGDEDQKRSLAQSLKQNCAGGTGGTGGGTGENTCSDDNARCVRWSSNGECTKNPAYMLVYCKRSCGVCPSPTSTGIFTSTSSLLTSTRPETTTTEETGGTTCTNYNGNCARWAYIGECRRNPNYMLMYCPRSCRVCKPTTTTDAPPTSVTSSPTSAATTSLSPSPTFTTAPASTPTLSTDSTLTTKQTTTFVSATPTSMTSSLTEPSSSSISTNTPITKQTTTFVSATSTSMTSSLTDPSSSSYTQTSSNKSATTYTASTSISTLSITPSTTPFTTIQSTVTTTTEACIDEGTYCPTWKSWGECRANPEYMLVYCKLSCGICSTIATPEPNCVDQDINCPAWAAYYCQTNLHVMQNCKKSCETC